MGKKVGVIGGGQMGNGIAQVAATAGCEVTVFDISETALAKAVESIQKNLGRMVKKEIIAEADILTIMAKIKTVTAMDSMSKGFDFIIEAATENFDIKCDIFKKLTAGLDERTIVCTNTSSLPITKLATASDRPDRFIGMHFMNPVPVMKLVEVIPGLGTSGDTLNAVIKLAEEMGKVTAISKDQPGFIANRILIPMLNEAMFTVYEGIGDVVSVDTSMKLGMNHPMGPLTLADFIGLDTVLYVLGVLYEGFKDPKFRPCPLLSQLVNGGYFGVKSGQGFYDYSQTPPKPRF